MSVQSLPRFEKGKEQVIEAKEEGRRNNVYRVASRTSSDRYFYRRDLSMLMKLCVRSNEIDLALDLGECFVCSTKVNEMFVISNH